MLERREIDRHTLSPLLKMTLRADKTHLVASNPVTIAQAAYEPGGYVWGLWDGEIAVGLLAMIHPREYPDLQEGDGPDGAYIWRLLIDEKHQGKGYGRAALDLAAMQARIWALPRLSVSVVDAPDSNIGFYEKLGFRRTGGMVDGEIVLNRSV